MKYVIFGIKEGLYWSNDDGWGCFQTATRFTEEDRETLNLPIGGEWRREDREYFCEMQGCNNTGPGYQQVPACDDTGFATIYVCPTCADAQGF